MLSKPGPPHATKSARRKIAISSVLDALLFRIPITHRPTLNGKRTATPKAELGAAPFCPPFVSGRVPESSPASGEAVVVIVTVALFCLLSMIEEGVTEHRVPGGVPAQDSVTLPLNPGDGINNKE